MHITASVKYSKQVQALRRLCNLPPSTHLFPNKRHIHRPKKEKTEQVYRSTVAPNSDSSLAARLPSWHQLPKQQHSTNLPFSHAPTAPYSRRVRCG